MLTLSQMNPCGFSSISGPAGSGKSTVLRSLIEEVGIEPLFVIDMEQENWEDRRPDASYLSDVSTWSQLKDIVDFAPPGSIFFINGIQFLECPGALLEFLANLWATAQNRKLRIIFTFQVRKAPEGDALGRAIVENGPTLHGVTDGYVFSLQRDANA